MTKMKLKLYTIFIEFHWYYSGVNNFWSILKLETDDAPDQ